MPRSSDCIVVGGGIVGLAVARRLAQDGLSVTLLDRQACGREASWAGAGILVPARPDRPADLARLQNHSLELFPALCRSLLEETGIDPEYERCGEWRLILDERDLEQARADSEASRTTGAGSDGEPVWRMLSQNDVRETQPVATTEALGALHCASVAQVRNPRLLDGLRASCVKLGVSVREGVGVSSLILDGERVTGVRCGEEALTGGWIVLCAGAWSSSIDQRLAALMPVYPVRGQMILLKFDDRPLEGVISREKTYVVSRRDGTVLLGATEEHDSGFCKRVTPRGIQSLIERGLRLVPMLADAPVVATWAGLRPGTPDGRPYLGPVPGMAGLIAATGHFRSGLILAPATADVVGTIIQGQTAGLDISACRPGRALPEGPMGSQKALAP